MLKFVATGLAIHLLLVVGFHNREVVSSGVNGVFYNPQPPYGFASLVYWDKMVGQFPSAATDCRGGLICYKDGRVEAGYFIVGKSNRLLWNGSELDWSNVKWAISGGGLFLWEEKVFSSCEVIRKEKLSPYIVNHRRYSFILVHKDRRTITLGVSVDYKSPAQLAPRWKKRYYAFLRLDGGSQTRWWTNRKPPKNLHNGLAFGQDD